MLGSGKLPPHLPPKRTSYGVAAHHLRGAVGTKRRKTSGRERSCGNEFQRGCVAAFYGMHTGRSSGTPPLVRIRARHRCEFVWHRYVKAKALAAQSAEIPKNEAFFGVSFSAIFLHEKKDGMP